MMPYSRYFTSEVGNIFPTPVYTSKLEKKLTASELKFIDKNKKNTYKNDGNLTSKNHYILNEKPFKELKLQLELRVDDYFNKVICSSDDIKPYITQSWLNYTEETQYHHNHAHPNSLVSGVLYLNSDPEFDKIIFIKNVYHAIKPSIKEYNLWNSDSWYVPVKTGDILLFPSSLTHMVESKKGSNTRVSLAFNVFIKGEIGEGKKLDKLIL
jgi:uncharacterized protein (TIGR02466 family)